MKTKKTSVVCAATYIILAVAIGTQGAQASFLTPKHVFYDGAQGVVGLNSATDVEVSRDGRFIYTASSGDGAIAIFERDFDTDEISFLTSVHDDQAGFGSIAALKSIAISPDDQHLYAVGAEGLSVLARNSGTGAIEFLQVLKEGQAGVHGIGGAQDVVVNPDGNRVYVAASADDSIAVFLRDQATGLLVFAESLYHKTDVDGLAGASSVAVSPDGVRVFATGHTDGDLSAFWHDANGSLILADLLSYDAGGGEGLNEPWAIAVSPSGLDVYTGALTGNAIGVFSADPQTGALALVETQTNGYYGVSRLQEVRSLAVSPSGDYVYATGSQSNSIVTFQRDQETGSLEFKESRYSSEFAGVGDVPGLLGASAVAVSPDATQIYVAAEQSHALSVFTASEDTYMPKIRLNSGLNDAWYNPQIAGQGFFINVFPEIRQVFLAWFTYDIERPGQNVAAQLGDPGHRWLTAQGPYYWEDENTAELQVFRTVGGKFDSSSPVPDTEPDGWITLEFFDCRSGVVTYDLPASGQAGETPIFRISDENVPDCEEKDGVARPTAETLEERHQSHAEADDFHISPKLNDAWFNPETNGQGFFITVFPESEMLFLSWFTFDTVRPDESIPHQVGEPYHRWLTASGSYSGDTAHLEIDMTTGGVFNSANPTPSWSKDGWIDVTFDGCNGGTVTYYVESINYSGTIPIQRVSTDNVDDCESLGTQSRR